MNKHLRTARKASGKTQKQVADEVGVAEVAYQRYEYGDRLPNAITVQKLAKALNTTVETLFPINERTDDNERQDKESN